MRLLNNLNRFIEVQEPVYDRVIAELRAGKKSTHWMWFIFPQIDGLGRSKTAKYFAIKDQKEALSYLSHPVLSLRLIECTKAVLAIEGSTALNIFGHPDNLKLKSSMTLFARVSENNSIFQQVLDKFFEGQQDNKTLEILNNCQ